MHLILNDKKIDFKIINLTFEENNVESVFYNKNNKTLKQTFEHKKYSRLKLLLEKNLKII